LLGPLLSGVQLGEVGEVLLQYMEGPLGGRKISSGQLMLGSVM
jgi:hypothetical protein